MRSFGVAPELRLGPLAALAEGDAEVGQRAARLAGAGAVGRGVGGAGLRGGGAVLAHPAEVADAGQEEEEEEEEEEEGGGGGSASNIRGASGKGG